ncbi:hypothetical protein F4859DRAFT_519829 [Xylaria cf. heliscus]|nr:hypothetical protein F4859DRAFT_519829 [Xylaria cf. heliscus]
MQFAKFLLAVFASSAIGSSLRWGSNQDAARRTRAIESQGASGKDDDDAIAYAWFAEDE